jgi:3-hydroxybutyrate dehydrogenase
MLRGKSAIVTGSTSGIGLGIARTLATRGVNLMLNGFGSDREIENLKEEIRETYGVKVLYSAADMSRPQEINEMAREAAHQFGGVDILVNNAGIQHTASVQNFPPDKWDAIIAVNLTAAFHTIRGVLEGMLAKNWGRIINIASAHGLVASVDKVAYVAAKHGLLGMTKVVALETATTGVTCNAICPGWVLTPLVQRQIDDLAARENISTAAAKIKLLSEKQPSHEFVTVDQIGAAVAFLCSEPAAQIRGIAMPIDGGWTAQ